MIGSGFMNSGNITYGLKQSNNNALAIQSSFSITEKVAGIDLIQVIPVAQNSHAATNLGTKPFFDFDVAYDQLNGLIGLRKKYK